MLLNRAILRDPVDTILRLHMLLLLKVHLLSSEVTLSLEGSQKILRLDELGVVARHTCTLELLILLQRGSAHVKHAM